MHLQKILGIFVIVVLCLAGLDLSVAGASDQVCVQLQPDPVMAGQGTVILKVGVMDYGNGHMSISGTATSYAPVPDSALGTVGLVHGNAEIVGGKIEASLSGTTVLDNLENAFSYSYYLRLDPATLSGEYVVISSGLSSKGPASLISCQD